MPVLKNRRCWPVDRASSDPRHAPTSRWKRGIKLGIITLTVLWSGTTAATWAAQERMIFRVDSTPLTDPAEWWWARDARFELARLDTPDGLNLSFWASPPTEGMPVILYFHGAGGTAMKRSARMLRFARAGYGVVLASYRGYGGNPGSPTEAGLIEDARAYWRWVAQTWPGLPVVLFGESLGSHMAFRIAAEHEVAGVILDAPFTSVADVAAERMPLLPARLLLRHPFESLPLVQQVRAPLLVLHAEDDPLVPSRHGRTIVWAANGRAKGVFIPGSAHPTYRFAPEDLAREIETFLGSLRGR